MTAEQKQLPEAPRKLDPALTFDSIVAWIRQKAAEERAPGLIVGISGTDSILTFLACAKAFEQLGKPHRVLGLNFEHAQAAPEEPGKIVCASGAFNWVAAEIYPWLRTQAPQAQLEIDSSIPVSDDSKRWGHLFSRAVCETKKNHGLTAGHYFPVGTRNATEQALGSYSQLSRNVSMLPIIDLYKSEVLEICEYLGVPQIAIDKSREVDCDCGRFDTQANHMRELDLYLMHKKGLLSAEYIKNAMPRDVLNAVREFYVEESYTNAFRARTPYMPAQSLAVPAR
jgi:NH3-dependent NAD+ synthetase